jgi:alkylation response protein AidB-like acyl-CoA dehydrogenase
MKFELSEDQALLRSAIRDFLAAELPLDKTRRLMEDDARGYDPAAWRRLAGMGYVGLTVPAAAGGQGLGAIELAIVCEEMGRVGAPGPYLDAVLVADFLAGAGGQDPLLAELCEGKALVTLARADAPFAGDRGEPARFAEGRVRGRKFFVPFAAFADALLVVTPSGACLAQRPFEVTPLPTMDLSQRFGAVRLEHDAVLVAGPGALERADRLAAVAAAATLLGLLGRCLETTLAYLQTREAFRRPIGAFQALQHRMADMLLRAESTRSAVYRAAWCLDTGDPDAALACAAAKAYAGDAARHVCGEAIQMHGGIGFTWELDLHLYFKRAKTLEQLYGSTEQQLDGALTAAGF